MSIQGIKFTLLRLNIQFIEYIYQNRVHFLRSLKKKKKEEVHLNDVNLIKYLIQWLKKNHIYIIYT